MISEIMIPFLLQTNLRLNKFLFLTNALSQSNFRILKEFFNQQHLIKEQMNLSDFWN